MGEKHLNAVCAVTHNGDKILYTQRLREGPSYIAGHREFPSGKVNEGESDYEALRRKISEEIDWDVYIRTKLGSIKHDHPDFSICLTAYDCMVHDNDLKSFAYTDSCWLKSKEFSRPDWAEADAAFIKQPWR